MKKAEFYLLSLTWGLLHTLLGIIAAVVLLCAGYKPKMWGGCFHFEVGENWGGVSLGLVFITSKNPTPRTKNHEHGHAIQNCFFGPMFWFVVAIPSIIRYWYIVARLTLGYKYGKRYDSIWFEGQATELGTFVVEQWNKERNNEK